MYSMGRHHVKTENLQYQNIEIKVTRFVINFSGDYSKDINNLNLEAVLWYQRYWFYFSEVLLYRRINHMFIIIININIQ